MRRRDFITLLGGDIRRPCRSIRPLTPPAAQQPAMPVIEFLGSVIA